MSLEVQVRHRLGTFEIDAAFESAGRLTALFGASGSGKTSIINMIAGIISPTSGRIRLGGKLLLDTAQGLCTPTHKRRIGYVFQESRLFPHLSVRQNLGYGQWFAQRHERITDMAKTAALLGIEPLLDRKPHMLSGGERQRVAIGRALLAAPEALLMDEPLTSLDQGRKAEILPYIERLRDELRIPVIYVSHSVQEVARLASDIVVISGGRIKASGPAAAILQRADLIPSEQLGEASSLMEFSIKSYDPSFDLTRLEGKAGAISVPGNIGAIGDRLRVRIRAIDVMLATSMPRGLSALNILNGRIASIQPIEKASVDVALDCGGEMLAARVTRQSCAMLGLKPGLDAFAVLKTVSLDTPARS
jgi:molybdate transport system ATP-binding protein